uniref:Uncharacterized protein n=1 Tax=uncultured bacterium contig00001 TaxID=1181493 RepID=A0A806KJF3_9BACT|nr:hypothetical protein [uncultured bacterium contig00001]
MEVLGKVGLALSQSQTLDDLILHFLRDGLLSAEHHAAVLCGSTSLYEAKRTAAAENMDIESDNLYAILYSGRDGACTR